jgi:hypothetical protein
MRLILLVAIVSFGGIVAAEWWLWRPESPEISVRQPSAAAVSESAAMEVKDYSLPPLDQYRQIEERPLFIEGRRELEEEAPQAPPPPPPAPPKPKTPAPAVDLRGIMIIGNERIALLGRAVEKDGPTRLRKGDQIRDWTVSEISDDKLLLSNGSEQSSVELRKFSSVPLPAIPTATKVPDKAPQAPQAPAKVPPRDARKLPANAPQRR